MLPNSFMKLGPGHGGKWLPCLHEVSGLTPVSNNSNNNSKWLKKTINLCPVHTSCECDINFDVTDLRQTIHISWLVLNSCKTFTAKTAMWRQICSAFTGRTRLYNVIYAFVSVCWQLERERMYDGILDEPAWCTTCLSVLSMNWFIVLMQPSLTLSDWFCSLLLISPPHSPSRSHLGWGQVHLGIQFQVMVHGAAQDFFSGGKK